MIIGVIGGCYVAELFMANPPLGPVVHGALVPQFSGEESLLLAVGILGATVMPHVIYLHSALLQDRILPESDEQAKRLYRFTRIDVVIAMSLAGLINMAMLIMAASTFHDNGLTNVASIETAHQTLDADPRRRGEHDLRARAPLSRASRARPSGRCPGRSSCRASPGRRIPLVVRRLVTMLPRPSS